MFGAQNSRKAFDGRIAALLDPDIWTSIEQREKKLRDAIAANPKWKSTRSAYDRIKKAQAEIAKTAPRFAYLEQTRRSTSAYRNPRALNSTLFKYARLLTRAIDERTKPNSERMAIFRESGKESVELELFSTEPVYDDMEMLDLTDSLTDFAEQFGPDDPMVKQVLASKSPRARAVELVSGTKLKDVDLRKKLYAADAAGWRRRMIQCSTWRV